MRMFSEKCMAVNFPGEISKANVRGLSEKALSGRNGEISVPTTLFLILHNFLPDRGTLNFTN